MPLLRVLFIDDEPDIREVIAMSLGLDPNITAQGSASGEEGLAAAFANPPDLILLDVMMPFMDGPTTLQALRVNPRTAEIPVLFMTARAQSREIGHLKALGASGVIAKPFNPLTLAASVLQFIRPALRSLEIESKAMFLEQAGRSADALMKHRLALSRGPLPAEVLGEIGDLAHGLAGAADIIGFPDISAAAADLADMAFAELRATDQRGGVGRALDCLLARIGLHGPRADRVDASAILDVALLEELKANIGSDRTRALLERFDAQLDASLAGVTEKDPDRAVLIREAHRFISTAGILGFSALSDVARDVENACYDLEDGFAVLAKALARAAQVKVSTKRELGLMLAQMACAA